MSTKLSRAIFFMAISLVVGMLALLLITRVSLAQNVHDIPPRQLYGDTWATRASMSVPRDGLGVTAAQNGFIYAIGGRGNGSGLTAVEEYDPISNIWATRTDMPTARGYLGVTVAPNGMIYAIGGSNGSSLSTVEEYNPASNIWNARADMPTARYGLGVTVASNGKIYAIGGCNGGVLATVEEYDPVSNTWNSRADMPTARCYLSVVAAPNGKIYAIGGGGGTAFFSTVEEYDPINNTWATRTDMPTIRDSLGVTVAKNGMIYAIGGRNSGLVSLATVEEYNPNIDTWSRHTAMPTARDGLGISLALNDKIYAIGGWNGASLAIVEEYTPLSFFISGRVFEADNDPVSGVTVQLSNNGSTITNSSGYYTFTNLITGTYSITPTFGQYSFTPDTRIVILPPDATDQDFVALPPTPTDTLTSTSTPSATPTATSTATPSTTSTTTRTGAPSPTATSTYMNGYLAIVIKPFPPTSTPTLTPIPTNTPQPPSAPYLNPIDNSDQDNYYTVSWGIVNDAQSYVLEEATDASFSTPVTVYQGNNTSWIIPSPGKTPATYHYRVKAINTWGVSTWSNVQLVTIYPLFVGLNLSWDGMGYIRVEEYFDVGTHSTKVFDELTQGYIIRSVNNFWYDPNPQGWPPSNWFAYYSITTGDFLSSSEPSDPAWKWGEPWILPYNLQIQNGQTVTIDNQEFLVSGPFSGYTAFGVPVQYWELTNKRKFLYWDGGGDWKQYVHAGEIVLRYDAGSTRLEFYSNVLRRYYYQGAQTDYTVQYIDNLTASNSFPGSGFLFVPFSKQAPSQELDVWREKDTSILPGPRY